MTHRHRVANRRALETFAIEHDDGSSSQRYKIGLGREVTCVDRGRVGPVVEVFVNAQKVNSPLDVLASDGAILMSMLIQYGCPPAEIVKSMKHNSDGTPASPLGRAAALLAEATSPDTLSVSALAPATGAGTAAAPELSDPPVAAAGYFTQPGE